MTAALKQESDEAFRARHVGAAEVAALFDCHPWLTHFELFHRKAGTIDTPEFGGNERVEWGIRMEPVIIEAACERFGYRPLATPERLSNAKGFGGHPDKIVMCPRRGRTILEVKTADWLVAKKWGDEPPLNYLLQNQTYMGLSGCLHGDVIVLVGGNELRKFEYEFRPVLFADMEARVSEFWKSIADGTAPKPDFSRDGKTLIDVLGEPTDEVCDLSHDKHADELAIEFLDAKAAATAADLRADVAKAELLFRIGEAGFAKLGCHKITARKTKDSTGTLITEEMVGTYLGARKGYRRFDVKEL